MHWITSNEVESVCVVVVVVVVAAAAAAVFVVFLRSVCKTG
jgi:hypothetical protein